MHNKNNECDVHSNRPSPNHVNSFVSVNNIPYLWGEFQDRTLLTQLDRSFVEDHIIISQDIPGRTLINISVNDIPRNVKTKELDVRGNMTMNRNLVKQTRSLAHQLQNRFDVIRPGLLIRINYRIENSRTGRILRSVFEEITIRNYKYFVDINRKNLNNNAIVVNFLDTIVSSISNQISGKDPLQIRITSIDYFYQVLDRSRFIGETVTNDIRKRHPNFPTRHIHGLDCQCSGCRVNPASNPAWINFDRFYRFENDGRDIILHSSEIQNPQNMINEVQIGRVIINRLFAINPGHNLVFKVSLWRNDAVFVNNTSRVAHALGVMIVNPDWLKPFPPSKPPGISLEQKLDKLTSLLTNETILSKIETSQIQRLLEVFEYVKQELERRDVDNCEDEYCEEYCETDDEYVENEEPDVDVETDEMDEFEALIQELSENNKELSDDSYGLFEDDE